MCVCASKTKYKNCLCGFVYPNGDKKLRSIVLYMLYFGAMPFHNFFQPVFQIDSLENTKCIDKDILGFLTFLAYCSNSFLQLQQKNQHLVKFMTSSK